MSTAPCWLFTVCVLCFVVCALAIRLDSGPVVSQEKSRSGRVERALDERTLIVAGLLKKETSADAFTGLAVRLSTGESARILGPFAQSGKVMLLMRVMPMKVVVTMAMMQVRVGLEGQPAEATALRLAALSKKKRGPSDAVVAL